MAKRFQALMTTTPPEWVTVVLAAEYDELVKQRDHLQDCYDRLRGRMAAEAVFEQGHDQHCEQEGGEPCCSCRARRRRRQALAAATTAAPTAAPTAENDAAAEARPR